MAAAGGEGGGATILDEDVGEYILCSVDDVFVFKVPPTSSAEGYKAADWKEQVWDGSLKVVQKGDRCAVKLIGKDDKIFAIAPVRIDGPQAVEKVQDSSRYFVLRIENAQGKHAYIGLAFQHRNDAFDFKAAIADYEEEAKREKEGKNQLDLGPSEDFSLKEGQKIKIPTVNVKRKKDKEGRKGKSGGIAAPSSSGKSSSGSQPTSQSGDGSDDWVSF
eukprot:gb/GECG01015997.1/.p1 GENE.gb/GECG01015997.1/~~gb/GECG01015997.1/.p1  ORF type:complete len:218 (+),score=42.35 gb/GECG01015997.1/:1-654(+)